MLLGSGALLTTAPPAAAQKVKLEELLAQHAANLRTNGSAVVTPPYFLWRAM
jgi:hypothetical protein